MSLRLICPLLKMSSLGVGMAWITNLPINSFTLLGLSSSTHADPSSVKKTPLLKYLLIPSSVFLHKKFSFRLNMFHMTFVEPWRACVRKYSYYLANMRLLSILLSAKLNSFPPKLDIFVNFSCLTSPKRFALGTPILSKFISSHMYGSTDSSCFYGVEFFSSTYWGLLVLKSSPFVPSCD